MQAIVEIDRLDRPHAAGAAGTTNAATDDELDPMAQLALADAADASLLRLVLATAGATLLLALASSLASGLA